MRKTVTIFAILCAFLAFTLDALADAAPAAVLSPKIAASDGGEVWMFSDSNRTSKRKYADGTLTLSNPERTITGLYLIWDAPAPARCTVSAEGLAPITAQGFLHEFISLAGATGDVVITWQGNATLCDAVAFGGADIPDWVQLWQPAEGPCDLLVLPTHADDEHLFLSGAMVNAAATPGAEVQVAYMVNHNGEYYRPHELLNGLWAAGIRRYPIIPDFADIYCDSLAYAKTVYDEQAILDYQLALINRFRPQVIVGHDLNGEYGHGAHQLNAHTLTRAVAVAATLPDGWNTPKLYLHLYPQNAIITEFDVPLEAFGNKTGFEVAQAGFAAHKSQQQFFSVAQSGPYDCRKFGLFRTTVGADTTNDIFGNVTLYADQPPPIAPAESVPKSTQASVTSAAESKASTAKSNHQPQAINGRLYTFVGSPIALAIAATGLLVAVIALAIIISRRP